MDFLRTHGVTSQTLLLAVYDEMKGARQRKAIVLQCQAGEGVQNDVLGAIGSTGALVRQNSPSQGASVRRRARVVALAMTASGPDGRACSMHMATHHGDVSNALVNAVRRSQPIELDENILKLWSGISGLADPGDSERRELGDGRLAERGQEQRTSIALRQHVDLKR